MESVDTSDSHDDGQLGFRWDVEVAMFTGISGQAKLLGVSLFVLLGVRLGLLENSHAFGLVLLGKRKKGNIRGGLGLRGQEEEWIGPGRG